MKKAIREMYVYGTTIKSGCSKSRPTIYGELDVRTIVDDIVVTDHFKHSNNAFNFVNEIMSHYCVNEYDVRRRSNFKKGQKNFILEQIIVMDWRRRNTLVTIEIYH